MRIKIYCRSFDLKLYRLSKGLYESWGFPCVRLTDQTADGYFRTMLADTDCDIAINVDEDCFITSREAVMELVEYVVANNIANAGCPDGGGWVPRIGNPLVTNPFFNVLNLNLLREQAFDFRHSTFDYSAHKAAMVAAFPQDKLYEGRDYDFSRTDQEPYYTFFLWQAASTKTLYLDSRRHADHWTTILFNHLGHELCRHTWLARFYSVPAFAVRLWMPTAGKQQDRINAIIAEAYAMQGKQVPVFGLKDKLAFIGNKLVRWMIKVPQRIAGWPAKLRKLKKNTANRTFPLEKFANVQKM